MLTKEQARGAIQGYFILYKKTDSPQKENRTVLGKDTTSYLVTSLEEFIWYMFSMQAFNSKGVSAKSKQIERKTDQDSKLFRLPISTFMDRIHLFLSNSVPFSSF